MAGKTLDEIDYFDIYSCFPAAVAIACDELGLDRLDHRGLTVTGGLPFFGGPGNNYSMHAIASMVEQLREAPEPTVLSLPMGDTSPSTLVGCTPVSLTTSPGSCLIFTRFSRRLMA